MRPRLVKKAETRSVIRCIPANKTTAFALFYKARDAATLTRKSYKFTDSFLTKKLNTYGALFLILN
jgi:hypothetical protein